MSPPLALDTSVAVPLLVQTHSAHAAVTGWWAGRRVALSGHAAAETYSVLTRLPGDLRLTPPDAARLLDERFGPTFLLGPATVTRLPDVLSRLGIAGGAVYDALVALAARENGADLATRDARARDTYERVDVRVMGGRRGSHPPAPPEPGVNLSAHRAPIIRPVLQPFVA